MKKNPSSSATLLLLSVVALVLSPSVAMAQNTGSGTTEVVVEETESTSSSADKKAEVESAEEEETLEDGTKAEEKKKEEETDQSIGLSASLSFTMGQGLFTTLGSLKEGTGRGTRADQLRKPAISSRFSDSQVMTMGLSLGAGYSYKDHSVSLGIGGTQYLIGGENRFGDFVIGDLHAGYGWAGYKIEAINSRVSAGAGLGLPTSVGSRESGMLASLSGNVSFSTSIIDAFSFSMGLSVGKIFNKYNGGVAPIRYDQNGRPTIFARASELIGGDQAFVGGIPTEWSLGFGAGLSWKLWVLRFGLRYGFSNAWSYSVSVDPDKLSGAQNADGNSIVKGSSRRHSQSMSGSFSISYAPTVWWLKGVGFSLSFSNSQSPKTRDQLSFSFPFWNFEGANAGASAISLGISYGYDIPLD